MNTSTSRTNIAMLAIATNAVESSQLAAIGYDPASHTLQVDFKDNPNTVYQYPNVSPGFAAEFEAAESKGSFFYARVKGLAFHKFERATGNLLKTTVEGGDAAPASSEPQTQQAA